MNIIEEIVLDHSSMPEDLTEGAIDRDIELSELLTEGEWIEFDPCEIPCPEIKL